jgi:hypothetical protein
LRWFKEACGWNSERPGSDFPDNAIEAKEIIVKFTKDAAGVMGENGGEAMQAV